MTSHIVNWASTQPASGQATSRRGPRLPGARPASPSVSLLSHHVAGAQNAKRTKARATTDIAGAARPDADHSLDHNKPRQSALLSDSAKRIMPGQPRYAATCLLFASRDSWLLGHGEAVGECFRHNTVYAWIAGLPSKRSTALRRAARHKPDHIGIAGDFL